MRISSMISELHYYGLPVIMEHIRAILTKEDKRYILAKHKKCDTFSISKIEKLVSRKFYIIKHEKLDLENPKTFDEKITWLMLYDATPLKTRLVDKYAVREYVRDKIGDDYLIPILGVYDSFDEISFDSLPEQFVLKLNNGSGMNIIVRDKNLFDISDAKKKFDYWIKTNFAYQNFELQYRDVEQKIIVEKYMEQMDGNLYDYKIHCFDGIVRICQVIGDRDLNAQSAYQAFFDADWNRINESEGSYPEYEYAPSKPKNWDEMKRVAEKLAQGFNYVRIDLYSLGERIYFGEYTFTPHAGLHPVFIPESTDLKWGEAIQLPEKYILDARTNRTR